MFTLIPSFVCSQTAKPAAGAAVATNDTPITLLAAKFKRKPEELRGQLLAVPKKGPRLQSMEAMADSSTKEKKQKESLPSPLRGLVTHQKAQLIESSEMDPFFALIGDGYNSLNGTPGGACVEFDPNNPSKYLYSASATTGNTNADVQFYLREIETVDELLKELSLDASAEFGFGAFKGDASVSYFNQYRHSKYTRFLVVRVTVAYEAEGLFNPKPTTFGTQAMAGGAQNFLTACGNKYIRGVIRGGDFAGIVRYEAESETQLTQLTMELHAAGGSWSASADLKQKIESIKSYKKREVSVVRRGTEDPLPDDFAAMEAYAVSFPDKLKTASNRVTIALVKDDLKNVFNNFPPSILEQEAAFEPIANTESTGKKILNGIDFIKRNQENFPPLPLDTPQRVKQFETLLENVHELAATCSRNLSADCRRPYKPALPITKLPEQIVWSRVDPATPADQKLGASSVGEYAIISEGCWLPHSPKPTWVICVPGSDGGGLGYKYQSLQAGTKPTEYAPILGVTAIPQNAIIYVKLFDSVYDDNASYGPNPIQAGIFEITEAVAPSVTKYLQTIEPYPKSQD
jgi:hypothetical protein